MVNGRARLLASTVLALGFATAYVPVARAGTTIIDGAGKAGKFVSADTQLQAANSAVSTTSSQVIGADSGGVVAVGSAGTQTVYTNFATTGGNGSGGGAGLGGVFFVDTGSTLTLTNVSFNNNSVKGGQGGGIATSSVGSGAFGVAGTTADASAARVFLPTLGDITYNGGGSFSVGSLTTAGNNELIAVGGGVAQRIGATSANTAIQATVASITNVGTDDNGNDLNKIALSQPIALDGSNVVTGLVANIFDDQTVYVTSSASPISVQKKQTVYYKDGSGNTQTTTVTGVNFDSNGNLSSYTVADHLGAFTQVATPAVQSFDITRFRATLGSSNTITPAGAIGGFAVGMNVTGAGVPAGTTVTAVDLNTGVITLSQAIDQSAVISIKGSFSPLIANSGGQSTVQVATLTGLAVGQSVTGTGIPDGTTITAIDPASKQITLSNEIGADGVTAIAKGKQTITNHPVISVDTNAKTVTLASVAGLTVGTLLTGDALIPANSIITAINASTKTITYRTDATAANLIKGGTLNGLKSFGAPPTDGTGGQTGQTYSANFDNGEGAVGSNGGNGGAGSNTAGGNGGKGGSGSNGSQVNVGLVTSTVLDAATLAADFLRTSSDAAGLFTLPSVAGDIAHTVVDALVAVKDIVQLVAWQVAEKQGTIALGGGGGAGGNAGAGSDFFGGGSGGAGGNGGQGAESYTIGGPGGQGGAGGTGGFGAGGGQGGRGGQPGANGITGSAGGGGAGGFGGGVGSTFAIGSSLSSGGGGGSGYGGAIFVRSGGTLEIDGNAIFQNNAAFGGNSNNGGAAGISAGSDLFIMTGANVVLNPGTGHTITFNDTIADDSSASIGSASIAAGQGATVHITGGGTVQFFGTNTYSGTTDIAGATLEAQDGTGINTSSHILFSGSGTIGSGLSPETAGVLLSGGTFLRPVGSQPNNVSWSGSGGFAATSGGLTVNLGSINGGVGPALTWNAGNFVPTGSTLVFGSDAVDATGPITWLNAINLNGLNGKVAVYHNAGSTADGITSYDAVMAGALTGGTLTVNDTGYGGSLLLTGQNTLTGLTLNNGTLSTTNGTVTGRLADPTSGASVTINGGSLLLGGAEKLASVSISSPGSLLALAGITSGSIVNSGVATFRSTLGASSISNSGVLGLKGLTTVSGSVTNTSSGTIQQGANLSADSATNSGTWNQAADITTATTFNNFGTLTVIGTLAGTPTVETAATRTITTAGFTGSSLGSVKLGGLQGVANTLVINQSDTSDYFGTFVGAGSLTKTGAGTLRLGGANTFTGPLRVNAGAISTSDGATFADSLDAYVGASGSLFLATADTIRTLTNSGFVSISAPITLTTLTNTSGSEVDVRTGSSLTVTGDVTNAGLLQFYNASAGTISGSVTNSGTLSSQGTLAITGQLLNNTGAFAQFYSAGSATLGSIDNSGTVENERSLTVTGNVKNNSGGILYLNDAAQFGSLTNAGAVTINHDITVTGAYTQNAGTVAVDDKVLTTGTFSGSGGTITLNDASLFLINQAANGTYSGAITGSGTVTKQGTATLTLAGAADSFAASAVTVHAGGLTVQNAGILDAALAVTVDSAGTLTLLANQSIATLGNTGQTLLAADLTTSGGVTNDGTLTVVGSGSPAVAATRTITTAGFSGASTGVVQLGGATGTLANSLVISQSGDTSYFGTFVGAGGLTKTGSGSLNLGGANTFTGPLTINAGTLTTAAGATFADSLDAYVARNAYFTLKTQDTIHSLTNSGATDIYAPITLTTLTNQTGGFTILHSGSLTAVDVSNAYALYLYGGTTTHVSNSLTNTNLFISNDVLTVDGQLLNDTGAAARLGLAPPGTNLSTAQTTLGSLLNKGALDAYTPLTVTGNVTNSTTGVLTLYAGSAPTFGSLTNAGTLVANDPLSVSGNGTNSGTLTLNATSNTFGSLTNQSGGTLVAKGGIVASGAVINAGSLTTATLSGTSLTNSGALSSSGPVSISGAYSQNAGSLTATGGLSTGSLAGSGGAINLNSASVYALNQTANGTYAGTITGNGGLVKNGAADLTISGGVNSFSPSYLTINTGKVIIAQAGALNKALTATVNSGGTLALGGAQTIDTLTSTGTVNLGSFDLTLVHGGALNGTTTGTGQIGITSGVLAINGAVNNGGGTFAVGTGATINVSATGSITTGALNVSGGTLNLIGPATANATTVNNGGTLHLGNGLNLGTMGASSASLTTATLTVNGNGFLTGNGTVSGAVTLGGASAGSILPGNSPGIITVGSITFDNLSIAGMQVDGGAGAGVAGGNDQIVVNGALALKPGSTLAISKSAPNGFDLALGQQIKLFSFAPGAVSGNFGTVTATGFSNNVIYTIATGSVIGIGSQTGAQLQTALSTTPNRTALLGALLVNTTGGVNQYYGGNLLGYVTTALASGNAGATDTAFARWSPEGYAGIVDHMKQAVIDNLLDLSSYDTLTAGRTYATGNVSYGNQDGAHQAGYARNTFRDTAFNAGLAHQFAGFEVSVSYGHTDGRVKGDYLQATVSGNQVIGGVSLPVAFGQKLRAIGRVTYGDYTSHGTRATNSGAASFAGVQSQTTAYGFGFAWHQGGKTQLDLSAEAIGMDQVLHGFTETGGAIGSAGTLDLLHIGDTHHTAWIGKFDAKLGTELAKDLVGYATVSYQHELGRELTPITGNVNVEAITFTVNNPGLARDRVMGGIGARYSLTPSVQLTVDAKGGSNSSYNFGGGLRIVF